MKVQTIHEHKVAEDLLPQTAIILDLGCRGFGFTDYFLQKGHQVEPVDIDDLPDLRKYHQVGIHGYNGRCDIDINADPQATKLKAGGVLPCYTLESFIELLGYDMVDLVKIDVEGAELPIIQSLKKAPAKQLSIEFHLHTGAYKEEHVAAMVDKLTSLGYSTVSHEKTEAHGAGFNYWSSLFILL